jgi:hypothetical protein
MLALVSSHGAKGELEARGGWLETRKSRDIRVIPR